MFKSLNHGATIMVCLDEIHLSQRKIERILRRDHAQITQMRADYESGRAMEPIVLRPRFDGGYNVEDGRHRFIAALQAGLRLIEASIVGNTNEWSRDLTDTQEATNSGGGKRFAATERERRSFSTKRSNDTIGGRSYDKNTKSRWIGRLSLDEF